jgi:hypothetical protein
MPRYCIREKPIHINFCIMYVQLHSWNFQKINSYSSKSKYANITELIKNMFWRKRKMKAFKRGTWKKCGRFPSRLQPRIQPQSGGLLVKIHVRLFGTKCHSFAVAIIHSPRWAANPPMDSASCGCPSRRSILDHCAPGSVWPITQIDGTIVVNHNCGGNGVSQSNRHKCWRGMGCLI